MAFCRIYICVSFKFQVNLIHVASTCKNAADEKLRQTIRRFADIHGSPAAIIIISGDINFAADLNDLRHRYSLSVCNRDFDTRYTGCPRRNVPDFGRVFLMLKYTDITQNTYVQSWTVKEILAKEKCGLLTGPRTVPVSWQSYPCLPLSVVSYDSSSAHARLIPECVVNLLTSPLGSHLSCILLGTLRTTMTWVRVFL